MALKDELSDIWSDLDNELDRIGKALADLGHVQFRNLEDTFSDMEKDLTSARAAATRLEKLIDKLEEE